MEVWLLPREIAAGMPILVSGRQLSKIITEFQSHEFAVKRTDPEVLELAKDTWNRLNNLHLRENRFMRLIAHAFLNSYGEQLHKIDADLRGDIHHFLYHKDF